MGRQLSAKPVAPWGAQSNSRLSLIFRPGQRPSAADILRLSRSFQAGAAAAAGAAVPGFAVSHQPEPGAGWVELLAGGLTFELTGLAPATAAAMPATAHFYGIPAENLAAPAQALTLVPGEQWRGGKKLMPVLRIMAGVASRLAQLAGVTAVVWHPARCAMAPRLFCAAIDNWLDGGPFPALGLTALFADTDNSLRSEGLAFFIGRELLVEPYLGKSTAVYAKIATRLINQLVGSDPINQPLDFIGPNGERLSVDPLGNDGFLRVWRKT